MEVSWTVWFFVPVFGFAAAGMLNALHEMLVVAPARAQAAGDFMVLGDFLQFHSILASAWSIIVLMFGGPSLIIRHGIWFWRNGHLPFGGLSLCFAASFVWACFAGILIIEALAATGLLG